MIRVLVAHHDPVIRSGLAALVDLPGRVSVCAEVGDGRSALNEAVRIRPHVVLTAAELDVVDGLRVARTLGRRAGVVVVAAEHQQDLVVEAIRAGAAGFLLLGQFDAAELQRAITAVHRGGSYVAPRATARLFEVVRAVAHPAPGTPSTLPHGLTEREAEVLTLIVRGMSNSRIAETLFITEKTVKNHINRAYHKLGATDRQEAIRLWQGLEAAA